MLNPSEKFNDDGFQNFCAYLQKASGITIGEDKLYLVTTRIRGVMSDYGFDNLYALVRALNAGDRTLYHRVINAMTVNETFWFRDSYPFDCFYHTFLPRWHKDPTYKHRPIRIWSAACSSGQEPYSLAMLIEEYRALHPFDNKIEIIATDLSSDILNQAKIGEYDHLSIGRGLSKDRLNKHFSIKDDNTWTINTNVRQHITFRNINLLDPYSNLGKFDMIFCRNVLIYFTKISKSDIICRMRSILNSRGVLCLGASETLGDAAVHFQSMNCKPGVLFEVK